MERALLLAVAICAGPLSAAAATPAPGRLITNPDWAERPDGSLLGAMFPKLPLALQISGYAQLKCSVNAVGALEDCVVAEEWPAGMGFGAAALRMSARFRMRPRTVDGEAVAGGTVSIPLRFAIPPPPPASPAQGSAEGRALAARIVRVMALEKPVTDSLERQAAELDVGPVPATSEEARKAAAAALRAATAAHAEDIRSALAAAMVATYSDGELRSIAEFEESPSGELVHGDVLSNAVKGFSAQVVPDVQAEAHAALCAHRACRPSAIEAQAVAARGDAAVLDAPAWAEAPTPAALRFATPSLPGGLGVEGAVRMTCAAHPDGTVDDCAVAVEAPTGWGFGAAAQRLAPKYRLASPPANAGTRVTIRVAFPSTAPPEYVSNTMNMAPEATAIARRLIEAEAKKARFDQSVASLKAYVARQAPPGIDPALLADVKAALDVGVDRALDRLWDRTARELAANYTLAQLQGLADFHASATGQAIEAKQQQYQDANGRAGRWLAAVIASDARDAFCKTHDCRLQGAPAPTGGPPQGPAGP